MINILDGLVINDQEIEYYENKESALEVLIEHGFSVGEIFVVGYFSKANPKRPDIMVALGIGSGRGPENYRIIQDKGVVVVTAVLSNIPDVMSIALNQIYLARNQEDGNSLYFLRRRDTGEDEKTAQIDKKKMDEKAVVIDASTGDIYIAYPPYGLLNLYDLSGKPQIKNVEVVGDDVSIDLEHNGNLYEGLHFLTDEEKKYLKNQVISSDFEITITSKKYGSSGSIVNSDDPCDIEKVIYTLVAKYKGKQVKLEKTPDGWTYNSGDNTYTKEVLGNKTSYSGDPICQYDGNSITAKGIYTEIKKRFFIISSPNVPTPSDLITEGRDILVDSPEGLYSVFPKSGSYIWFLFPQDMIPGHITHLGLNFVLGSTTNIPGITWKNKNLGTYIAYRSRVLQNNLNKDIVIWQ